MLILGFVLLLASEAASEHQLKQVHIVFRHGDRTPTHVFPGDTNTEETWPQGFGQLTVKGMQQQFELGQFLRARYIESSPPLLGPSYNRSEVFVRSTDFDRTIMSVQCQLAGLFPPGDGQVWNPNLPWQPIPIYTEPVDKDSAASKCHSTMQSDTQSDLIKSFFDQNRALLQWISNQSGVLVDEVNSMTDALNIESWYGRRLPPWANATVLSLLRQVQDLYFTVAVVGPEKSRLQGGFHLRRLLDNMDVADNTSTKLFLFSAHDSTVASLLGALQVFDGRAPSYASAVIVELWQEDSSPVVKVFYKRGFNDTDPQLLTVPGCSSACPLFLLRNLSRDYLPVDCKSDPQSTTFPTALLGGITASTSVI